ncbi:MAG: hypothetical protein K6C06_01775, partial [Lachnospiraceae bacterium]|nr:hypothetical protein [Lachnospiraceae bacterium]
MITAEMNSTDYTVLRRPGAYIGCFGNGGDTSLRIVIAESSASGPNILTLSGRQLSSLRPFDLSSVLRLRGDSVYSLSSGSFSDELSRYTQAHALLFPAPYTGKYPLLPILGPFYHPYFELLCKAGLGRLADHLLEQLTNGPFSPDADSDSETAPVYPPLGSAANPREIYGLSIQCLRKAQIWSALPEFSAFLKNLRKLYAVSPSCADLSHYSRSWTLMIAKHLAVCSDPADG